MGISERYNRPNESFDRLTLHTPELQTSEFSNSTASPPAIPIRIYCWDSEFHGAIDPGSNSYERWVNSGAYFQDDFRVTSKLTVNLGIRWSFDRRRLRPGTSVRPSTEKTAISSFRPPRRNSSSAPISRPSQAWKLRPRRVCPPAHCSTATILTFAPRVSFAWELMPKTVLRGGYGIYYTPLISTLTAYFEGGPFQSSEVYYNSISNGVPLFQFPDTFAATAGAANGPSTVNAVDSNLRTPTCSSGTSRWSMSCPGES